ncbi:SLC13 family permease [Actinophytocola algeriensis]|uniref:Di/tricarboxylate transporter n=1 Tax=Actinophytocola algeriensis TaxID=1768010 RepID=A0A7W7Q6I8_9PSEU|nr:SLC13 family permease [Actinophytocola algeriensis]MBB4907758.1 di/tricarboxylate transporter [Actinophytocola algeriensis]MBE1479788.1 di/tricarboxylate transporter [Actinophytocola algeriensis]
MSAELISIIALVAIFVLATTLSVNMGALAFAGAFLVGTLAGGLDADGIFAGFPGDIFVVLVGVTYLFAIARANGTTDWLVAAAVRLVGGRIALIPWVMFVVTGTLTAIGAVSPAACAIVAPIALGFAAKYNISPLLMGAMVVHGAQGGGFSPISVYGTIVNGIVERNDLPGSPVVLFLASLAMNTAVAAILFVLLGGTKLSRTRELAVSGPPATEPGAPDSPAAASGSPVAPAAVDSASAQAADSGSSAPAAGSGSSAPVAAASSTAGASSSAPVATTTMTLDPEAVRLDVPKAATLLGLVVLVVSTLVFDLDAGLSAITVAVVLSVLWPASSRKAVGEITWPTVLLICGVLTYVAVLQEIGTITYVGNVVGDVGIPLLAALLLCYIGGIVSAFASSVGLMGALIPLAVPFLSQGTIGAVGMIAALAVAATMVDVSPFSTNGALVLANAKDVDRDRFFKQLLTYGAIVVAVAPLVAWLVFVVPGWG